MPFIFRFEHDRNKCEHPFFNAEGESLTGHGTFSGCLNFATTIGRKPNFGLKGSAPFPLMPHERCAVTAEQFNDWISENPLCRYEFPACEGYNYCAHCTVDYSLDMGVDWLLVAYWVNDDKEGIDWRLNNNQVVFNPEFAELIGPITLWEIEQFVGCVYSTQNY